MTWTLANLIIQIVSGILAAHAVPGAVHDRTFGVSGRTIIGALAGALSGYFLQSFVIAVESDFFNEPNTVELVVGQAVTGFVVGGIAALLASFVKQAINQDKSATN